MTDDKSETRAAQSGTEIRPRSRDGMDEAIQIVKAMLAYNREKSEAKTLPDIRKDVHRMAMITLELVLKRLQERQSEVHVADAERSDKVE